MKHASAFIALALLALLFTASTFSSTEDSTVKQLTAEADFKAAQSASNMPPQPDTGFANDVLQTADRLTHEFAMHREDNKVYDLLIVSTLALVSLFMVLRFITAKAVNAGPHIVNATGLICIIFGTILLVLMAQSDQQLTAAVGILGAVAGYLFRSMHQGENGKEQK